MSEVMDVQVAAAEPVFRRHKLDLCEVERMVEAGILAEAAGMELIDSELIDMHPIGLERSGLVLRLTRRLVLAFGERAAIGVQSAVRLDEHNQPQPGYAALRPRADDYMRAHATAGDVIVLIDLAKTPSPMIAAAGVVSTTTVCRPGEARSHLGAHATTMPVLRTNSSGRRSTDQVTQ